MGALKSFLLTVSGLCVILLLSSCGGAANTSSSSNGYQPAPTDTPATTSNQSTSTKSYGAAPPATTSSAVVKTVALTVSGKSMMVLTDAQGKTLYYFVPDTSQKTACTSSCAETWPPLLSSGAGKVSAAATLPGALAIYKNANGNQVIYNDHPLYTFSGDTSSGQSNGQGIGGQWFVATPSLAKNK